MKKLMILACAFSMLLCFAGCSEPQEKNEGQFSAAVLESSAEGVTVLPFYNEAEYAEGTLFIPSGDATPSGLTRGDGVSVSYSGEYSSARVTKVEQTARVVSLSETAPEGERQTCRDSGGNELMSFILPEGLECEQTAGDGSVSVRIWEAGKEYDGHGRGFRLKLSYDPAGAAMLDVQPGDKMEDAFLMSGLAAVVVLPEESSNPVQLSLLIGGDGAKCRASVYCLKQNWEKFEESTWLILNSLELPAA